MSSILRPQNRMAYFRLKSPLPSWKKVRAPPPPPLSEMKTKRKICHSAFYSAVVIVPPCSNGVEENALINDQFPELLQQIDINSNNYLFLKNCRAGHSLKKKSSVCKKLCLSNFSHSQAFCSSLHKIQKFRFIHFYWCTYAYSTEVEILFPLSNIWLPRVDLYATYDFKTSRPRLSSS